MFNWGGIFQPRPGQPDLKEDRGGGAAADADHAPGGGQGAGTAGHDGPDNGPHPAETGPADVHATTAAGSRQAAVHESKDRTHFCTRVYGEEHVPRHPQAVRDDDVRCTGAEPAGTDVELCQAGRSGRQKLQHMITSQRRRRAGGGSNCGGGTTAGEVETAGDGRIKFLRSVKSEEHCENFWRCL